MDLSSHPVPPHTPHTLELSDFKLSSEQIEFFNKNGYLSNLKILDHEKIEQIISEFTTLSLETDNPLWHEFHSNETGETMCIDLINRGS